MYLTPLAMVSALLALALAVSSATSPPAFPEQIAGWRLAERASYGRSNLFDFIDGGAEVYLAYGFRQVWVGSYRQPGAPEVMAEVYDMGSDSDAYGVLSIDLTGEAVPVGSVARYGAGLVRFCKGRWFLRVLAERETPATRAMVMALGAELAQAISEVSLPPRLLSLLPAEGLQENSATFFHTRITLNQLYYLADENLLGLGPDTDAVIADYRLRSGEAKLLLVRYPDEARCRAARAAFLAGYLERGETGGAEEPVVEQVEGGRFVGLQAKPPYLALVLEAPDAESAAQLLARAAEHVTGGKVDG